MFHVPYRWSRRPLENISSLYYDFIYGVKNLIRWFPLVWDDRDWDWAYMARMMRKKLVWMADSIEENKRHVNYQRDVRQMRICAELLRRILQEDFSYSDQWSGIERDACPFSEQYLVRRWDQRESEDCKLLGRILGRHFQSWWD